MPPVLTLIICATPRTGSTLLCALLNASGIAGRPESWYRAEDREDYADDWNLPRGPSGRVDPAAYLSAAIRAGQTSNGVCGVRIQARTLPEMIPELRRLFPAAGSERAVLEQAFGPCRFIYIRREDDVAQAISRLKAEVSQVWHHDGRPEPANPAQASYDADRLDAFRAESAAGNVLWQGWFAAQEVSPIRLVYEAFSADPAGHVHAQPTDLGLSPPPLHTITAPNRRMADDISRAWAERYRADRGLA